MRTSQTEHRRPSGQGRHIIDHTRAAHADTDAAALCLEAGMYTWWRRYPADQIAPHAATVGAELDGLSAADLDLRNALRADVVAAIRLAIGQRSACHPFAITTDLVMTTLMRCALDGSAPAKIVMANIIKSCRFEHDRRAWLTGSWFSFKTPVVSRGSRRAVKAPLHQKTNNGCVERDHHRQKD